MCGLHAVFNVGTVYNSDIPKYLEQAFVVNSLRGTDSSGMFVVSDDGKLNTHKMALQGPLFVESKVTKSMLTDSARCRVAVGHVRAATTGKVNVDNAHPFVAYDNDGHKVVGVHNGTLSDWRSNVGASLYEVDSEWAIQHIAEERIDAFEDFHGAFAFIWWRESDPTKVWVARNDHRPLHFAITPDKKTMYLGSEFGMVSWLTDRINIKSLDDSIFQIEAGKLYEFDLSGSELSWRKLDLPKPVTRRTTYTNTTTTTTAAGNSFPESGAKVVREVNEVLDRAAAAATPAAATTPAVTTDPAPRRATKAERKRQRREERERQRKLAERIGQSDEELVLPDNWFSQTMSTHNEKTAAKSMNIFGQLVTFTPTHYEPDLADLYGTIEEDMLSAGSKQQQAVLRGIKPSVANAIVHGQRLPWAAVIGMTPHNVQSQQRYVILGELTEEGKNSLELVV